MIRYNEVSITTWISHDYKTLTPNGKLLWLYLLTGPVRMPLPGIYRAGVGTCTDDLGWSAEAFKKAFKELEKKGMAKSDWVFNVMYLPNWRKYNRPPANPNVFKSWLGMLDSVPDSDLKMEYIGSIGEMCAESGNDAFVNLLNEWMNSRRKKLNRVPAPPQQIKVEVDEKYSDLAYIYLKSVRKAFPKLSIFKNGSMNQLMGLGAKEIEKVCRLDNYKLEEVQEVLEWVVSSYDESADFNWLTNLQSLKSLRKKGKNGNTKFENIYNSYNSSLNKNKKKERKIDYSDVSSPI